MRFVITDNDIQVNVQRLSFINNVIHWNTIID